MRIKGNEWLRVKQVKETLVSSECQTKMVKDWEDRGESEKGARKVLGCLGIAGALDRKSASLKMRVRESGNACSSTQ